MLQFVEVAYFDFNLQVLALFLAVILGTVDRFVDASGKIHVIVFEQNHVEQTDTMVYTTTDFDCHLFEDTHTRSCLAGIQYAGVSAFQYLCILAGHGCDTAHTLHDVQHQAFGLEQGLYFSFYDHSYVARFHFSAVINKHFHFHGRVETVEDFFGNFDSGQYTGFFDQ